MTKWKAFIQPNYICSSLVKMVGIKEEDMHTDKNIQTGKKES